MLTIETRNVNQIVPQIMRMMATEGKLEETRVGPAFTTRGPVTTLYEEPRERVLFSPARDANPFFHFMEGLWMLNGNNDVAWISQFSSKIGQYSDNGKTFHGAYGHRWRHFVGLGSGVETEMDQLQALIQILIKNPNDRRAVLQMWNPIIDLGRDGKDFPCNTSIMFRVWEGKLDMTVTNRSNDMLLGAYGANVVHMSMLHEFMASAIGVEVGFYWQVANNFHAYKDTMDRFAGVLEEVPCDPYMEGEVQPYKMVSIGWKPWLEDLSVFMADGPIVGFRDPFFRKVVTPLYLAWKSYKEKDYEQALENVSRCKATDWQKACREWLERRMPK